MRFDWAPTASSSPPWRTAVRRRAIDRQSIAANRGAIGNDLLIFADSGARSGLDVVRMLALGAKGVLLGRATAFALAAAGQAGVEHVLEIFEREIRVAMTLTGVNSVGQIDQEILARHSTPRSV